MNNSKLIRCHFTLQELEYINDLIAREQILTSFVTRQLRCLELLNVRLPKLEQPNIIGKLLSYIKHAKETV
jgi:hypothetical protein